MSITLIYFETTCLITTRALNAFFSFLLSYILYWISIDDQWNGARRRNRPLPLPSASSDSGVVDIADLNKLLTDLNKHPDSWPFHQPVTRAEAPDYHRVIKTPMDLGTMKYKLNTIQYKNSEEFIEDLQLMFTNCYTYNNEDADEYK